MTLTICLIHYLKRHNRTTHMNHAFGRQVLLCQGYGGSCQRKTFSMKPLLLTTFFLILGVPVFSQPTVDDVQSWEGRFKRKTLSLVLKTNSLPDLHLWIYILESGSKGTCIGFATDGGNMLLPPAPSQKGVQPMYTGHSVFAKEGGAARVVVTYDIQGNGGMQLAEEYLWDGKDVTLSARSQYFGKHDPVWKSIEP